jgi:LysM repeat protein
MIKRLIIAMALVFTLALTVIPTAGAQVNCAAIHVIQPGENLFRISLRYGVSMQGIAQVNGIADFRRIYAGDTLCIPQGAIVTVDTQPFAPITPLPVVNTGDDNWCNPGRPWGDGRCLDPNAFVQAYNFRAGWCKAKIASGAIMGGTCLGIDFSGFDAMPPVGSTPPIDDGNPPDDPPVNPTGACVVTDLGGNTFALEASWNAPIAGQSMARFRVEMDIIISTYVDNFQINLSSGATSASDVVVINAPFPNNLDSASFTIADAGGATLFGPVGCAVNDP